MSVGLERGWASPRFSVVTPSFNQSDYLAETLESVLSQEGDFSIEHVVVDGGSTDRSVDVLGAQAEALRRGERRLACRGVRLRWVSEPDRGQSDAINKGLRLASGDYVAYLNSDDVYAPGCLARVAREFAARPAADFVHGDGEVIDQDSRPVWSWLSRPYSYRLLRSYHPLWNDFTNYILQQATFWRRSVHDRIGLFDESLHYSMDLEFWLRAGAAGLRFRHLPEKLAGFRMIEGTKSLSSPTAFWSDNMEVFRRHHRPGSMGLFFCYFHFNHALAAGLRLGPALRAEAELFRRWSRLPASENASLRRSAERGRRWARLLLAVKHHERGQARRGAASFRRGSRGRPWLALHPFSLTYLLRRALAPPREGRLLAAWARGVRCYRSRRYLHRYR